MAHARWLLWFALLSGACHSSPGGTPDAGTPLSASKLGPHMNGDTANAGAATILAACPRIAKWVAPNAHVSETLASYKDRCPGGTVVLRIYVPPSTSYTTANDPSASAADFWSKMQAAGLSAVATPSQIDWLEGPNELDNLPKWYADAGTAAWMASFWSRLADLMHAAGYAPLVGSLVSGQPAPVTNFGPLAAAMKAKGYRWGWSYHSYTFGATMSAATESAYALYYRQIRDQNGLAGIPLVISEGGYLTTSTSGWQGKLTGDQYLAWLEWFDGQLKQDPEVVGFTIFAAGYTADFATFDLTPIAAGLASYLASSH